MGRALKIQKTGPNQGVGSPGASVTVDAGYPNFASLTNPVYNSDNTLTPTNFLGVVGGSPATSTASPTFPEIAALVNISLADGTSTGSGAGRIIRQKGSHKFLVASTAAQVTAGSFIVGQAYQIVDPSNTVWTSIGGPATAAAGDIFTATGVGAGSGTAYAVGQCILQNSGAPDAGYMSISFSLGDSSPVYASYITNKWVRDWSGMTYGNYSNSNLGVNIQSGENFYPANFFTDEGTVTWSGAEVVGGAQAQNGALQLAQVASVVS